MTLSFLRPLRSLASSSAGVAGLAATSGRRPAVVDGRRRGPRGRPRRLDLLEIDTPEHPRRAHRRLGRSIGVGAAGWDLRPVRAMAEAAQPAPSAPRDRRRRVSISPTTGGGSGAGATAAGGGGGGANRHLRRKRRKILFADLADQLGRLGNRITFGRQLRGWLVGDFLDLAAANESAGGAQLGDALARRAAAFTQHVLGNDALFADADLRLWGRARGFPSPARSPRR